MTDNAVHNGIISVRGLCKDFDNVRVLRNLDLEISEIPDYLDENGIDSAAIIEKLNELAAQTGAPDGYDVSDFINGEELEGVTVGMLMFGVQDDSYLEIFNEAIDYLREKSLYVTFLYLDYLF